MSLKFQIDLMRRVSHCSLVPPPDDHSRVKLENSENDYINASLVAVEEAQRAYILSQVGA